MQYDGGMTPFMDGFADELVKTAAFAQEEPRTRMGLVRGMAKAFDDLMTPAKSPEQRARDQLKEKTTKDKELKKLLGLPKLST